MWSQYDYSNLPIVKVTFSGKLNEDNQYYNFIRQWTLLYQKQTNFKFIFDTSSCGYVNIKYALKMPFFIKKIKNLPQQYLQESIIIYNSSWIRYLLSLIFNIQSPVAPVYLVAKDDYQEDMIHNINLYSDKVTIIKPS
jgi:transposase